MKNIFFLVLIVTGFACTKPVESPSVVGNWSAKGVSRTYLANGKYADLIYIQSDSITPLLYDSIFGTYHTESQKNKAIIRMNPTGYRLKSSGEIITRDGFNESYKYGIRDSVLSLENEYYSIEFYKHK